MHRGSFESVFDNIAIQVASKIFTIALNMLIFHKADGNVLGILNVRLALFATTTLAVSREPFRESCMKNPKDHNWPQVINLLWLAVPSTVFFSIVCRLIWLYWFELPAEQYVSDYTTAIIILGVSCFVESLAEPVYVFSRIFNYVSFRLIVEGIMMIVKTVILAVAVLYHDYYPAYSLIIAGAYGQLAASIIYVVLYWSYFHLEFKKKRKLAENRSSNPNDPLLTLPFDSLYNLIPGQSWFNMDQVRHSTRIIVKGIFKEVLTEGERHIMSWFAVLSFAEQGVYDGVINLGSMVPRIIFLPIEQENKKFFMEKINTMIPIEQNPRENIEQAASRLHILLRGLVLFGLIILVFGWPYSHLLLRIFGGANLANGSGSLLLGAHCVAVSLMGINGITEAYVSAAMDLQQLDKNNFFMGLFASIMLIISVLLSKSFGSVGFILANYVNMSCRTLYSLWFINDHYRNLPFKPLRGIMPSLYILKYFIFASAATAFSWWKIYPESAVLHFVVGAFCGSLVLQAIKFGDYELSNLITGNLQKRFGKQINNVINLVYAFLRRLWRKWHNLQYDPKKSDHPQEESVQYLGLCSTQSSNFSHGYSSTID